MTAHWRAAGARGGGLHAPVELRFVDMFMTAVGSLIFLALLLVCLVDWLPRQAPAHSPTSSAPPDPFRIATTVLLPGRVGDPYSMALAYRGGTGRVRWSLSAGKDTLPPGVEFDADQGEVRGAPTRPGLYRFVVAATDEGGVSDSRGYQIFVQRLYTNRSSVGAWVAGVLLAVIVVLAFYHRLVATYCRDHAKDAERAFREGATVYGYRFGAHGQTTYDLPEGIKLLEANAVQFERRFWVLAAAGAVVAAYAIWAIWF
ncbi:MAG: putative Ig domain-containing protein [Roseiarcus sp.]